MKTFACSRLLGLVVLAGVVLTTTAETSAYTDYYMEDHCSPSNTADRYRARTETQSISFRLKSPLQERLDERGCRAGLSFTTVNETYGFLVTPVAIDIPRGPTNSCVNFIWFDGLAEDELNGKRLCGDSFPKTSAVRTKGDRFTIWWSSEPSKDADRKASFNVVIASYVNRSSEAECPESWRRCDNGACLEPLVWCDGIDNCGDGSDETEANCGESPSTVLSIPGIIIIAVIVVLVIIAIGVVVYVCKRRRAYRAA
ncbi:uncharacterized protein [Dermacentor andersoni]|uniref:uncharacterized protein isoform X1 n=1 Tax=Dermacentor andersoni TaxID=34620 RepID=UPI002155EDEC|nr:transmembrane protease serine 7-like isoform X1 [Dermacentor andersoni]